MSSKRLSRAVHDVVKKEPIRPGQPGKGQIETKMLRACPVSWSTSLKIYSNKKQTGPSLHMGQYLDNEDELSRFPSVINLLTCSHNMSHN